MAKLKILYVASEINPFLKHSPLSDYVRTLAESMQEHDVEVRILVPKFGVINERRNRLHEVIRLSGINIRVGEEDRPLIIKVASIREAKLQVYFIDNEDYFKRKSVFADKEGKFHEDNDERAVFFCKGVLETIKQLEWKPDIVHCHDWMSSFIPLYLKTTYKDEPIFQDAKSIFTGHTHNHNIEHGFDKERIILKAGSEEIPPHMFDALHVPTFEGLVNLGVTHADVNTLHKLQEFDPAQHIRIDDSSLSSEDLAAYIALYTAVRNQMAQQAQEEVTA